MRFADRQVRRRANDDERILPLINVVFLLLIFFMIAGQLSATDPFRISPPQSSSAGAIGERDMQLLVGADGRLALDGEELGETELRRAVAARLEARLELKADARLELKADGAAEATTVVAVMELLREAGLEGLTLLTVPEGE